MSTDQDTRMLDSESILDFLMFRFTAPELRSFIASLRGGRRLLAELPGEVASMSNLASKALKCLQKNAAIDGDFWSRLREHRPNLAAKINSLQAAFPGIAHASSTQLSLILARASRQDRYTDVEFIIHNQSEDPQFIQEIRATATNLIVDYTPEFKFEPEVRGKRLIVSLHNEGWSDLEFDLHLDVRPGQFREPRSTILLSGETQTLADLSEQQIFPAEGDHYGYLGIHGRFRDRRNNIDGHLSENIPIRKKQFSPDSWTAACPIGPDTVYVCLFGTSDATDYKRYNILRKIPPEHSDVFACRVSAERSATFGLVLELISTDGTILTTRHEGVTVTRKPNDRSLADGSEFALQRNGAWHLTSRSAPRRFND